MDGDSFVMKIWLVPPTTNARDGMHWTAKSRLNAIWDGLISKALLECTPNIKPPFMLEFTSYVIQPADLDNNAARVKPITDALVTAGVLEEDNPDIICAFFPSQVRVSKRVQQHVEVRYTPVSKGSTFKILVCGPAEETA